MVRFDSCSATGIRIARAPTFLVGMDSSAVAPAITGTRLAADFRRASRGRSVSSINPDRATAELVISAQAMITTTSLVKPVKAALAGTTPTAIPARSAPTATRS